MRTTWYTCIYKKLMWTKTRYVGQCGLDREGEGPLYLVGLHGGWLHLFYYGNVKWYQKYVVSLCIVVSKPSAWKYGAKSVFYLCDKTDNAAGKINRQIFKKIAKIDQLDKIRTTTTTTTKTTYRWQRHCVLKYSKLTTWQLFPAWKSNPPPQTWAKMSRREGERNARR